MAGGREIMQKVSPAGPVYQAGTLSGNPLAMAAGLATLEALHEAGVYEQLDKMTMRLIAGLEDAARDAGVEVFQTGVGSMACLFFQAGPVTDWTSATQSDTAFYARFFHAMLDRGVYLAPSQFEAMFVSLAHTAGLVDHTVAMVREAPQEASRSGS